MKPRDVTICWMTPQLIFPLPWENKQLISLSGGREFFRLEQFIFEKHVIKMATRMNNTTIYRKTIDRERAIGYVNSEGIIYKLRSDEGTRVGRVSDEGRIFRDTRYDERDLGSFTEDGVI